MIEAAEKQGDFIKELKNKGLKESTIKGWQKRISLASRVLQEKFAGKGVALSGGTTESRKDKDEKHYEQLLEQLLQANRKRRLAETLDDATAIFEAEVKPKLDQIAGKVTNARFVASLLAAHAFNAEEEVPKESPDGKRYRLDAWEGAKKTLEGPMLTIRSSNPPLATVFFNLLRKVNAEYEQFQQTTSPPPIAPEKARRLSRKEAAMPPPPMIEVPLKEEKVEVSPFEVPKVLEKPRVDLTQAWQGLRERFRIKADIKLGERLKALGKPLSSEKAKALLEKQKAAAGKRKEALGKIWERMRGISVLPSASAVEDWVDQVWAKVSTPFGKLTEEEIEAGLTAQKIEWRAPEFRRVKEWRESWQEMDPETRRKIAIRVGVGAAVGVVGGLVAYEIIGRHGKEFQIIAQNFSGITQTVREMLARAPTPTELPKPVTEVAEGAKEVVEKGAEIVKKVITKPEIMIKREVIKEAVKEAAKLPWDTESWREMVKQALAAKAEAVQAATEQVRQIVQAGIEIAKDSNPWKVSAEAAKQVFEASGVQSDPERLTILTDAINKAGGLPDLVQPGTELVLKPETTADILTNAIEKIGQVIARGGAEGLKVPADQEDLQALARVVEFLRGFK